MPINGYSSPKCQQRSRIAAARFGVDAAPLRLRGHAPADLKGDGFTVLSSQGTLPQTPEEAFSLINAKRPEGADELGANDVFIHFLEAANSNFVSDRSLYLGDTTLKNIALGGEARVAFMNAHRTGGLSSPSELPFGQTFCGCFEQGINADGSAAMRSTLGVFLLRGVHPNGANGPSTDDLDAGMRAGTVADVSVGLSEGEPICDVCGEDLTAYKTDDKGNPVTNKYGEFQALCLHLPGTCHSMSAEQIATQKQRDPQNSKGVATYTLHNARLGEVSAVYDGAVPGAGVRKVMQFARSRDFHTPEGEAILREAFAFFGSLLPFDVSTNTMKTEHETAADETAPAPDETETVPTEMPETPEVEAAPAMEGETEQLASLALDATPENIARLQAALVARDEELSSARKTHLAATLAQKTAARESFAASLAPKIPLCARPHFNALFCALQNGSAKPEHLETALSGMPKHPALEPVPVNLTKVEPPVSQDDAAKKEERRVELLSQTERGREILAEEEKSKSK